MGIDKEGERKGNLERTDSDFSVHPSGPVAEMWGNAQVWISLISRSVYMLQMAIFLPLFMAE